MKRRLFLLLLITFLIGACIGCSTKDKGNDTQVLYVHSEIAPIQKAYRTNGDCTILYDTFDVHWSASGCVVRTHSDEEAQQVSLQVGELKEIEIFAVPSSLNYEFYLALEGEGFPDAWTERFSENERKQQEKDKFGYFENYVKSRDSEAELAMIQDAFQKANLKQNAEIWYLLFLNETWSHGDVSIKITGAKVEKRESEDSVNLTLTDTDGHEMILYGFVNDTIDMVVYQGKVYAGPYTG